MRLVYVIPDQLDLVFPLVLQLQFGCTYSLSEYLVHFLTCSTGVWEKRSGVWDKRSPQNGHFIKRAIIVVFLLIFCSLVSEARHFSCNHGFIFTTVSFVYMNPKYKVWIWVYCLCQSHGIGVNKSETSWNAASKDLWLYGSSTPQKLIHRQSRNKIFNS